jgi:hypothetical protein
LYYEKQRVNNFVMPARHYSTTGDNTASVLTADGLKLFDAAVDWASTWWLSPLSVARQANGSVTMPLPAFQSTDALSPANWQPVTGSGSVTSSQRAKGIYRSALRSGLASMHAWEPRVPGRAASIFNH